MGAARCLESIGSEAKPAIPLLIELLNDEDKHVRDAAADALGAIGPAAKAAVPALAQLLKDGDWPIRRVAATALGKMGPEARPAIPALMEMLKATRWIERSEAASALGKIGSDAKPAVPALEALLKDENKGVRKAARDALNSIGHNDAMGDVPNSYPSPAAIFDAYRKARDKRDARAVFSLLTPEAQSDAVFETVFSCMERQGTDAITGRRSDAKEIGRIVEKHFDYPAVVDDYNTQYKKKHGTDPKTSPHDDKVWYDAVTAHVKDKAGFYVAVTKHFEERAAKLHEEKPVSPLGDLEHVVVQDDTATGHAATFGFHYETPPGKPTQKVEDRIDKTFKFRRINGGWLLDSL